MLLTRGLVSEALKGIDEVQRECDRVPKRFKITYSSAKALEHCYISNIGKGGVFIKTDKPLKRGDKVSLKLFLPDGGKELEIMGEVAWSSEKKHRTPLGEHPPGMGVKFVDISAEDKVRIDKVLRQSKT
jgi:type IV pilus assembly protein PilZ